MEPMKEKKNHPVKTVLAIREAKFVQVYYTDGSGVEQVQFAAVFPDNGVFIIPREDLHLGGVHPWFSQGVLTALANKKKVAVPKAVEASNGNT